VNDDDPSDPFILDPVDVLAVEANIDGAWVPLEFERRQSSLRPNRIREASGPVSVTTPGRVGTMALRAKVHLRARETSADPRQRGAVIAECERTVPLGQLRVFDPTTRFALGAHDEAFRARVYTMLIERFGGLTPRAGVSGRSRSSGSSALAPNESFDFDFEAVQGDVVVPLGQASWIGAVQSTLLIGRDGIDPARPWILRFTPRLDRAEPELKEPTRIYDAIIEIPRGPIEDPADDRPDDGAAQP
jgi:hypothetical protein